MVLGVETNTYLKSEAPYRPSKEEFDLDQEGVILGQERFVSYGYLNKSLDEINLGSSISS
jgi:hypothetical protein